MNWISKFNKRGGEMKTKTIIGFDCGNSTYRVVVGKFEDRKIETKVAAQLPNDMVKIGDYYYWDILRLFTDFKHILKELISNGEKIDSIGICTWGVDFSLFDKNGNMVNNPLAYRNTIGEAYLSRLNEAKRKEMFGATGILCDKINSIYLLQGIREKMPGIYAAGDKLLMIPDILNYMMTGVMVNEPSELSTTQIMDVRTKTISQVVCKETGIDKELFSTIGKHGECIGFVTEDIKMEIGASYDIPVICVPSHDTAAAVAAVPAPGETFAFISSGTWSLIGTELSRPLITEQIREAGLTNEAGAFDTITLLKNSAGMFIIQRIKKEYELEVNHEVTWDDMVQLSDSYMGEEILLIDINHIRFFNPGKMGEEVWKYLEETKQIATSFHWNAVVRAIYASMACSYAVTIRDMESAAKREFQRIFIVGGGARNAIVNQMTADCTGKTVVACLGESTSMGNIASQLKYFDDTIDLDSIREIIARSVKTKEFLVQKNTKAYVERYEQIIKGR